MSEPTFVYPAHALFEQYRELAQDCELEPVIDVVAGIGVVLPGFSTGREIALRFQPCDVPYDMAFGDTDWTAITGPDWTKKPEARQQEFWHYRDGLNTLSPNKRWPNDIVNHGYRVVNKGEGYKNCPQANEMLTYGVGTLRPRSVETVGISAALGEAAMRIDSALTEYQGTYIVDSPLGNSMALVSTNLVMPEVVGELEQLNERRHDTTLIKSYLRDMAETMKPVTPYDGGVAVPPAMAVVKPAWRAAHLNHLQTGLWTEVPGSSSELVDRVQELLGRIVIDENPIELRQIS